MDFRDGLSALLPPPRDDEPTTLRQDILDELGDHLACAYNRELLRGADSTVARQRVLERFGDPAAVARRLWFDAMKGKIMAQRVFIASCVLVTAASLALVGLVWRQLSMTQREAASAAAAAMRAMALRNDKAQATQEEMLKQMREMSDAIKNPRSLDWNPVKFVVTDDTPDGPPVAGCSISIYLKDTPQKPIGRTSDASGIADFGLVNPGEYLFYVSRKRDRGTQASNGQSVVDPGSQITKRVLWPKKALEPVPLHVRCEWPADLEKEGLVVYAPFRFAHTEKDGTSWSLNYGMGSAAHSVLFGPGDALTEILIPTGLYIWGNQVQSLRADILSSDVQAIKAGTEPLKWERGTYHVPELMILRTRDSTPGATGRQQFDILVRVRPRGTDAGFFHFLKKPPTAEELTSKEGTNGNTGMTSMMNVQNLETELDLPEKSWSKVDRRFEARPDRANDWVITLPDALIKAVRAAIKAKPSGKQKLTAPAEVM
jgi:hypothetical protein